MDLFLAAGLRRMNRPFAAMTILSLFFLLKDGPAIRSWTERHIGVPAPVARIITDRTISSLRGYFLGTTLVAVFSAVVVGITSIRGTAGGQAFAADFRYTDTWVYRDRVWWMVASHASRLPEH